ncbi:response regulator transcription factor [Nocardioides zeae]|uniref:Response regulator transcription factor n=1 Tax=Nocardioides imazamoxiresistens TaxID=3231893 RepID=A0ABU3PYM2_9ACTN|nr:response regulator transcription factor [Nocardioides zeae]MDT9594338.1 response regulator transcription factor [Nocardioides zeae]
MSPLPLRLALANDHEIVVAGLTRMLEPFADRVRVVEVAAGRRVGDEADIVLFDTFAQSVDAVALEEVAPPSVPVVVFTWAEGEAARERALDWGAVACVPKSLAATELVDVLVALAAEAQDGGPHLRRARARRATEGRVRRWPGQRAGLTERESEVLALVVAGHSNAEIAALLHLSVNSVKTYLRHAYRKAEVGRRSQAVVWALDHGFTRGGAGRDAHGG